MRELFFRYQSHALTTVGSHLNRNKIQMASSTERFAIFGEAEIEKLLEDKDLLNTKRSTKASRIAKQLT